MTDIDINGLPGALSFTGVFKVQNGHAIPDATRLGLLVFQRFRPPGLVQIVPAIEGGVRKPLLSSVRRTGKAGSSTSRMITSFSEAGRAGTIFPDRIGCVELGGVGYDHG